MSHAEQQQGLDATAAPLELEAALHRTDVAIALVHGLARRLTTPPCSRPVRWCALSRARSNHQEQRMDNTATTLWDLYREIHKAIRYALFGVTTLAGQTDAADADALRRLRDEWRQVAFVLEGHHRHEDLFCDPLIRRHVPDLMPAIETAHQRSGVAIARLRRMADRLTQAGADDVCALLRSFYLDLGDFTSMVLVHLRDEEDRVMPALNAAMSNDELASVTAAIRGSVTPEDMCVFIRFMVPAMNVAERLDMLGGMHAGAPPEVFEMFRAAAEASLPAAEYARLEQAGGFAKQQVRAGAVAI